MTSSEKMIKEFYDKTLIKFIFYSALLAGVLIKVETPLQLIREVARNPLRIEKLIPRETWSKAKGYPYITNYYKEVKSRLIYWQKRKHGVVKRAKRVSVYGKKPRLTFATNTSLKWCKTLKIVE